LVKPGAALALLVLACVPGWAAAQGDAGDSATDARIRASAEAAESLQGPLDGHWTLIGTDGSAIFAFQIVEKPSGEPPEGVWRDLRKPSVPGDIGMIDALARNQGALNISLVETPGAAATTIALKSGTDGSWSGQMVEGGKTTTVTMKR
jgi:hypothetical protein